MADVKSLSLGSVVVTAVSVGVVLLRRSQSLAMGAAPEAAASTTPLVIKLVFSGVLTVAALYVVLAQRHGKPRYDPDTKKWAFSALSLISGVWIGTATA
jgi:hypothetical protein